MRLLMSLLRERTALTLISATIVGLLLGFLRDDRHKGLLPNMFQVMKTDWRECSDIVLAGDSRMRTAVSPSEMRSILSDRVILNYAFGHAGFYGKYLSAIERILDSASSHKTIILGITPLSLTKGSVRNNVFLDYTNKPESQKRMIRYCGRLLHFFRPYSPVDVMSIMKRSATCGENFEEYASDGWLAFHSEARKEFVPGIYANVFDPRRSGPVSPDIIDGLIRAVNNWGKNSIAVYGFRPPTSPEMISFEDDRAQFDERNFVSRFEEAGGTWLEFGPAAFAMVDCSHLCADSALEFSRLLAGKISCPASDVNEEQ